MKLGLLVMVAVAILLPNFSESRIVSKCELRDKLGKMINLPVKSKEKTLAIVICEMEHRSDLNTTLVESFGKCIPATPKPTVVTSQSARKARQMITGAATLTNNNSTSTGMSNSTTASHAITTTSKHEGTKDNKEGGKEKGKGHDKGSSEEDAEARNLYGLFQLSDRKFCNSGYCPSENVCHTSCTAFTDDDITDDIACVIQTGYWKEIEETASASCLHTLNFFKQCN